MENYCFNTFSCLGLDLKPQKCVFQAWWRHKPTFTIACCHTVINFNWKCCFSSSSRKTIVYICFHYFAVSSKQDNESLRFGWRHNDATSLYIKVTSGYRQFSTLWHIENNNQKPNLSQKKNAERFEIATCLPQGLWPPSLVKWGLTVRSFHP